MGWNCWECCKCYRQSPKNSIWGYACDDAEKQGFKHIGVVYWQEKDEKRPAHWSGEHKPGPISVYSILCESCHKISVEEYFQLVYGNVANHNYRYQGGNGASSILPISYRYKYNSCGYAYNCGICLREVENKKDYNGWIKAGMVSIAHILFCESCRKKTTIKEALSLEAHEEKKQKEQWEEQWKKRQL